MRKLTMGCLAIGLLGLLFCWLAPGNQTARAVPVEAMLAHDVYFTLNDASPDAKEKLIEACRTYLSDHPGTVWFAAGARVVQNQREVNDQDFDVALHIVFADKASHDQYQIAAKHKQFIQENSTNWKKVRVFDSYLFATSHVAAAAESEDSDEAKEP